MIRYFIALCFALLGVGGMQALPMGNPAEASLFERGLWSDACECYYLRMGFYSDYVFDRHLEVDLNDHDPDLEGTKITTQAAYFALGINHRIDLFATFGASFFELNGFNSAFGNTFTRDIFIKTDTDYSWSVGAHATIWQWKCFEFGAEGQYFQTSPRIRYVESGGDDEFPYDASFDYAEWQFGGGVAYFLDFVPCGLPLEIVPYAGIKWARVRVSMGDLLIFANDVREATLFDLAESKCVGYAIGCSAVFCQMLGLSIEWRFADERAFYFNGQISF